MTQNKAKSLAWDNGYLISSGLALSGWGYAEVFRKEDVELHGEEARPIKIFNKPYSEKKNVIIAYNYTELNKIS